MPYDQKKVVEALRDAVVAAYPRLSHRYYALKAKWLGLSGFQIAMASPLCRSGVDNRGL